MKRTTSASIAITGFLIGSIGIYTVWFAFDSSCDQGDCDGSLLPVTAATAWIALLVGIIAVVVRTRSLVGPWLLQLVAVILGINLLLIAANRVIT